MVVDYSKWDKLELSDDSDIEVHPNVDKKSFIRWKQQDIHEKREQLKFRMKQLELNKEVNTDLSAMMQDLLKASETESISTDVGASVLLAGRNTTKKSPTLLDDGQAAPLYSDMIENLLLQITGEVDSSKGDLETQFITKLKEHQQRLAETMEQEQKEYEQLVEERGKHILSDDIRTGFDSTMINKGASSSTTAATTATGKAKGKEELLEVLNNPSASEQAAISESINPDIEASADAIKFSQIAVGDYRSSESFLKSHQHIINEKDKDGLMMQAFDEQLAGQTAEMRRTVHNALLLQYSATIGKPATEKLFERLANPMHPASQAFLKDVEQTVNHIIKRCEIIGQERDEALEHGGVEQIQLHAVDPDTEISVRVPEPGEEGYEVYEGFTPELKKAIAAKSLEEINKILGELSIEDAEELVRQFDECGVLMVEEKIYDHEQWQVKKDELQKADEGKSAAELLVDDVD